MPPLLHLTNLLAIAPLHASHLRRSLFQRSLTFLQRWHVQHSLARSRRSLTAGAQLISSENKHFVDHRHSTLVLGVEIH
jgi:hypothetical protein